MRRHADVTAALAARLVLALLLVPPAAAIAATPAVTSTPTAIGVTPAVPPRPSAIEPASLSPRVAEAIAYEHGEGVPRDPERAAALYCAAARDGDADALFNLGWMYANGRGIGRDYDIAATLFARAAAAGNAQAARVLTLFRQGHASLPDCLQEERPGAQAAPFDLVRAEEDPFADLPAHKQKIADAVAQIAPTYGIDPRLALAVITVESNFDPRARSEKDARGLMQLIPQTAARFRVKDAFDVRDNIRGGLSYLRFLLAYYRGRVALAAAAYNAGEKAVDRYGGVPPYAETRDYVRRVMALFNREEHPYDPAAAQASPIVDVRHARLGP
jgi:TPR repeat protein